MKLGLQGITVVIATGDSGVAGSAKQCCKYHNCAGRAYNAAYGAGYFVPSFPASCLSLRLWELRRFFLVRLLQLRKKLVRIPFTRVVGSAMCFLRRIIRLLLSRNI